MLKFIHDEHGSNLVSITDDFDTGEKARLSGSVVITRNDMKNMDEAELIAERACELTGEKYVAVDQGAHHYPRYDVVRAPHVGDEVSYAFNGDYYPAGKVAKISDSLRVVTLEGGRKFYRRRQTGSWINNGTWSLIQGHVDRRNPHF